MSSQHMKVFLVEPLAPEFEQILRDAVQLERFTSLEEDDMVREATEADGIIIRAKGRITRRVIDAAPKLRVIGRHGTGVDHIDLEAARERDIAVVNTPDANFWSTAEFTVGLMLAVARNIVAGDNLVRAERPWKLADGLTGCELRGKTLGVIGMGRIGQTVASMCGTAFKMPILYYDYKDRTWEPPSELNAKLSSLDYLLETSDVVTIHVPFLPATRHLINASRLAKMKTSAFLINTSRGAVIDEAALITCLKDKAIAGVALDVMEVEPLNGSPLQQMSNVVLTPHIASYSRESFNNMGAIVHDVLRVLRNQPPRHRVA